MPKGIKTVTAADAIALKHGDAVFITDKKYAEMCREAGVHEMNPVIFADEFSFTAAIAVTVNGKSGWLCLY